MKVRHIAAFFCAFLLAGCGGGGGASHDLTINFGYGNGIFVLWQATQRPVSATGLEGHVPSCSVVGGALPQGLSLESTGCRITGTPTLSDTTSVTIRMTVPGFNGQIDQALSFSVVGPPLLYALDLANQRGTPISARPGHLSSNADEQWHLGASDSVTYSLASGTLPAGLQLDASTGEIHGILTETAIRTFAVSATVVGPLGTTTSSSQTYTHNTVLAGLQFFYGPNDLPVTAQAGAPLTLRALFNFGFDLNAANYTLAGFRLAPSSPALPDGLTLNAVSGDLSGTPTAPGVYTLFVEAQLQAAGQSVWYPSSVLQLTVGP